jgi:geranylgeranyl reductase family protein
MESVDALVVGAGPAGSTAARSLARRGHRVLLVEEHGRVGHPVQCAGLVTHRVIDIAGSDRFVLGAVRGASVYGPDRARVSFRAAEPRAYVIDRAGLDIFLADEAARSGAEVRTGLKFDRLVRVGEEGALVRLRDREGADSELRARVVVGADGVASAVARAFRLRRPVEILPAFEAEFPSHECDPNDVEVYLGRAIAPGLFGWVIPDQAGGARIGVAAAADGTTARSYYERLLDRVERATGRRPKNPTGYIVSGIPVGQVPHTSGPRVVLVGDAAAQVKPLSGGGIFTGMRCAEIAADVLHGALTEGELDARSLQRYDVAWRSELGEELDKALYLRRVFVQLTDRDLEAVVGALNAVEHTETIVAFGDIDFPTGVARRLLRQSPSLLRLLPKAVRAFWGGGGVRAPELDRDDRRQAT